MKTIDVVVWVNSEQAHIYSFENGEIELVIDNQGRDGVEISSDFHSQTQFHKYFHEIFDSLKHVDRILLVGPGSIKTHLLRHALKHELNIEKKIIGIETLSTIDLPELHRFAKAYFN